jgi:hypothetical protein
MAWAQGFISGSNVANAEGANLYNNLAQTPQQMEGYLRRYCSEHPLDGFMQAVLDLKQMLPVIQLPLKSK